jgi:hypothetical protein
VTGNKKTFEMRVEGVISASWQLIVNAVVTWMVQEDVDYAWQAVRSIGNTAL